MRVLSAAADAIRDRRPAALVVVVSAGGSTPRCSGTRMLVYRDGTLVGTIGGGAIEYQVIQAAFGAIDAKRSCLYSAHLTRDLGMCCGGEMSVHIQPLEQRESLTIFGAGHVAHALAPIASSLEFELTIVDPREELNSSERFGEWRQVHADPVEHARTLSTGYALVVTHDHQLDQELVEVLIPNDNLGWVGMIGSRAKVTRFLIRLRSAGFAENLLQRLCAPVGLDVGAETPAEIAVSIAGELVRVRRHADRDALPLSSQGIAARGGQARPQCWPEK